MVGKVLLFKDGKTRPDGDVETHFILSMGRLWRDLDHRKRERLDLGSYLVRMLPARK